MSLNPLSRFILTPTHHGGFRRSPLIQLPSSIRFSRPSSSRVLRPDPPLAFASFRLPASSHFVLDPNPAQPTGQSLDPRFGFFPLPFPSEIDLALLLQRGRPRIQASSPTSAPFSLVRTLNRRNHNTHNTTSIRPNAIPPFPRFRFQFAILFHPIHRARPRPATSFPLPPSPRLLDPHCTAPHCTAPRIITTPPETLFRTPRSLAGLSFSSDSTLVPRNRL